MHIHLLQTDALQVQQVLQSTASLGFVCMKQETGISWSKEDSESFWGQSQKDHTLRSCHETQHLT